MIKGGRKKDEILANLTDTQKIALILLGARGGERIKGATWLQKEMFLISRNLDSILSETGFGADKLGPYSETLDEEIQQLAMENLVSQCGNQICLSAKGVEAAEALTNKAQPDITELVEDVKGFMNDLSEEELLGFVYFSFPDMTRESIKMRELQDKRRQIAVRLFRRGKISMEKASEMAGISLEEFMKVLRGDLR